MSPYLLIAALLASLGAGIGAGVVGYRMGIDHEKAQQLDQRELMAAVADEAAQTAARAIAQLKPKYTTIQNQLEKQIETHTVYRDCRLDAVSLQLANQALAPSGSATAGNSQLPGAHAAE